MALPQKHIKTINLPKQVEGQTVEDAYEVVPEMLTKNGYAAELPALTGNATLVITSDLTNIEKTPLISGTAAASVSIDSHKVYDFGTLTLAMSITLNAGPAGYSAEYYFRFTAGTGGAITLPNTCVYGAGEAPTLVVGHTYEYSIVDNLVVVGEFF